MKNEEILQLRERLLKLSTPSISDALDSLGFVNQNLPSLINRVEGQKVAGPIFTVTYEFFEKESGKFYNAGNYIDEVPENFVILINNQGNTLVTNWGNILTEMAILKKIAGTLVYGSARDIDTIRQIGYPLFSKGVSMVSGKNRNQIVAKETPVTIDGFQIFPGDWVLGDDSGVIAIKKEQLEEVLKRAEQVEVTEEAIVKAIKEGMPLVLARKKFNYTEPWEKNK